MNPRAWNCRKFATIDDPAHKSDLSNITGDYGCPKAFEFGKRTERDDDDGAHCSGPMVVGTAAHETIARALTKPELRDALIAGTAQPSVESVTTVFEAELEVAIDSREVHWRAKDGADGEKAIADKIAMVRGLLCDLHNHVAEVVAVERAYIAQLGPYWISGHIDIIYRPRFAPNTLAMGDWKTGAQIPAQVILDHGYESGFYSAAMRDGLFIDRADLRWEWSDEAQQWTATHEPTGTSVSHRTRFAAERDCLESALKTMARELVNVDEPGTLANVDEPGTLAEHATFGEFPTDLRYVHLADYVPYAKAGTKDPKRPEQVAFYNDREARGLCQRTPAGKVKYAAGDVRGPAWYRMQRREADVPRLESLLRKVVGLVRLGRFFEALGEKCSRCDYRDACLNSGYELRGDDVVAARRALAVLPANFDDGLGDVA